MEKYYRVRTRVRLTKQTTLVITTGMVILLRMLNAKSGARKDKAVKPRPDRCDGMVATQTSVEDAGGNDVVRVDI